MNKTIQKFDKWSEMMDRIKNGDRKREGMRNSSQTISEECTKWSGASSLDDAVSMLSRGWEKGIDRLRQLQRELPSDLFDCIMPVKDYKPELHHTIAGGIIDMGAHLSGATPETFITEKTPIDEGVIKKGRKLQTIYMSVSNSAHTNEDAFFYRGAYTFSLIEHLENCGYSCELWVTNIVSVMFDNSEASYSYFKVKEFGELFDANKLVSTLCSAFFLRRCVFSTLETLSYDLRRKFGFFDGGGYGIPRKNVPLHEIVLPEDQDLNPMWINTVNVDDKKEMLDAFRKILSDHIEGNVITE